MRHINIDILNMNIMDINNITNIRNTNMNNTNTNIKCINTIYTVININDTAQASKRIVRPTRLLDLALATQAGKNSRTRALSFVRLLTHNFAYSE